MAFRSSILVIISFLFASPSLRAQDNDYLRHGKVFCLCSFKKECNNCYSCDKDRYQVKMENKLDKKITKISYKFYSEVKNRILEKEAKIEGNIIDPKHVGLFYICVPPGLHWVISEIDYADGSSNTFTLKDRMDSFVQEADECDCNYTVNGID